MYVCIPSHINIHIFIFNYIYQISSVHTSASSSNPIYRVYSSLATFTFIIIFFSGEKVDFYYPQYIHLFCLSLAYNQSPHGSPPQPSRYWKHPSYHLLILDLPALLFSSLHGPDFTQLPSWHPPIHIFFTHNQKLEAKGRAVNLNTIIMLSKIFPLICGFQNHV